MHQVFAMTGTLTGNQSVALDEPLPASSGKVRVVVEIISPEAKPDLVTFMEQMWEQQKARGHVPRTQEQVVADLNAERDSWD